MKNIKNLSILFFLIILFFAKHHNSFAQCSATEQIPYGTFDNTSNGTNYAAYAWSNATTQAAPNTTDICCMAAGVCWEDPSGGLGGSGSGACSNGDWTINNTDDVYNDWATANNISAAPSGSGNFLLVNIDGGVGAATILSNTVNVVAGCQYTFSIQAAQLNAYGKSGRWVALDIPQIGAAGVYEATYDASNLCKNCGAGGTDNNPGWTTLTYTFTAASTGPLTVNLIENNTGNPSGNKVDWAYDNFSFKGVASAPISWVSFSATPSENRVLLTWQTGMEVNSDYFEVQRSDDGINWSAIGTVDSKNINSGAQYEFYDAEAKLNSDLYYRLKEVDFDNSSMMSETKTVFAVSNHNNSFLEVIPNVIDQENQVKIIFSNDMSSVIVYDQFGRSLLSGNINSDTKYLFIDCTSISPGLYIVKGISESGAIFTRKLIIK